MPLIDIECPNAHISEVNRFVADWPATPPCPTCGEPTTQILSRAHRPTWSVDPVVVFRAPDGSIRFPGDINGPGAAKYAKQGFERVELRGAAEVRRFEGQMNAVEYRKAEARTQALQAQAESRQREQRGALRQKMQSMSPFGRDVARAAMDRNDGKPGPRAHESGFHVEVYSMDRSNRDANRLSDGRRRRD